MIVGHEHIAAQLSTRIPTVSIFVGPHSIGKWTTAEHFRAKNQILDHDVIRIRGRLLVDTARQVQKFAASRPIGAARYVIINMHRASISAQNVLLKTLEESAPDVHFFLICSELPLTTIVTRAEVFEFSLLSDEQVKEVLMRRYKQSESIAEASAARARGSIYRAQESAERAESKPVVLAALTAIQSRDDRALDALALKWQDAHTELLIDWATEALTKRWRMFAEDEVPMTDDRLPFKLLRALRAKIRPRLVVRASLMTILKEHT